MEIYQLIPTAYNRVIAIIQRGILSSMNKILMRRKLVLNKKPTQMLESINHSKAFLCNERI
jgi:hypothetical protein